MIYALGLAAGAVAISFAALFREESERIPRREPDLATSEQLRNAHEILIRILNRKTMRIFGLPFEINLVAVCLIISHLGILGIGIESKALPGLV